MGSELGGLRGTYRSGRRFAVKMIGLGAFLMPVGLVFMLVPFLAPSEEAGVGTIVFVELLGLAILGLGATGPFIWNRQRRYRFELYDDGVVEFLGDRRRAVPWDDVVRIQVYRLQMRALGIPTARTARYTLFTAGGEPVVLTESIPEIDEIGPFVEKAVTSRVGPRVRADLAAGRAVSFGTVALSADGIVRKGKTLPWTEFAGHRLQNGALHVFARGKRIPWAVLPYSATDNGSVLTAELERRKGR